MAAPREATVILIEIIFAFIGITGCIMVKFNTKLSYAYMDELFHIPQAQKYCKGIFNEWDPMLTTPPGLYLFSIGVLKPVCWFFHIPPSVVCDVAWLRCINIIFAVTNLYLLVALTRKIHGHSQTYNDTRGVLTATALATFPVLYFFTFLYYTDSGSTCLVLLMYLLGLHGNHTLAATVGAASIFFRQTNIVWVIFVAGLIVADIIDDWMQLHKKETSSARLGDVTQLVLLWKRVLKCAQCNRMNLWELAIDILTKTWMYIMVGIGFAMFVYLNEGIVLGARGDHPAALHFPQLFYFCSFTAIFAFAHLVSPRKILDFVRLQFRKPLIAVTFCTVSAILICKFTFAHRYLLADNRHYTFYVWSKIYRRHELVKYCLIPAYFYGMWCMWTALRLKNILWKLVYILCVSMNLVPATLLEFRYFVIPYLIFRLNVPLGSYTKITIELLLYMTVNAATFYVFLEKTFLWQNEDAPQRFMW